MHGHDEHNAPGTIGTRPVSRQIDKRAAYLYTVCRSRRPSSGQVTELTANDSHQVDGGASNPIVLVVECTYVTWFCGAGCDRLRTYVNPAHWFSKCTLPTKGRA